MSKDAEYLSVNELNEMLYIDVKTSCLFWKNRPNRPAWSARWANRPVKGWIGDTGYFQFRILGRTFKAHRVVWALRCGKWPTCQIDHINGVRLDNQISNLREVSHTENTQNTKIRSDNTSGVIGVCWSKRFDKWLVRVGDHFVGYFHNFEDAVVARKFSEKQHGFHPNHGRGAA